MINAINQNNTNNLNFSAYIKSAFGKYGAESGTNVYYAKKGEPSYQIGMDSDEDGIITFEDFRNYCKDNNISKNEMAKMLELRTAYQMTQISKDEINKVEKIDEKENYKFGSLDLIYAEKNDGRFDEKMDTDGDSKISYKEYLRYCEQNARPELKNSDTRIQNTDKSKFMTVSYGKSANAYNRIELDVPEGKVEGIA